MNLFRKNSIRNFSLHDPRIARPLGTGEILVFLGTPDISYTLLPGGIVQSGLLPTGVTEGTYGSTTLIPVITVDINGRITAITEVPVSGSGGSVLLKTDGVTNPVQTLLNLVPGTNMTITDDGLGNITFDATGGGATYTVDNGLTASTLTNFQLGGSLIQNTIITSTGFKLDLISDVNFPGYALGVQNSGTGSGIFVQSVGGNGAIDAINNNGIGVVGTSSNGYGIRAVSNGNGTAFQAAQTKSTTNVVETIAQLFRETSSLGANGIGGSLDFYVETDNSSSIPLSHKLISKWTNATFASRVSQFEIEGVNNATTSRLFALTGAGQLILDKYGQSPANFPGTPVWSLGVDASGNVIEYTPTTGGGGGGRSYYLNGSVVQGTFGGITDMRQMSPVPVIGAGTDFTINTNGYIQSFITDAGDPNKAVIPAGNWNFELWFSANNPGGSPNFYVELSKYDTVGGTFTPISTSSGSPEGITNGVSIDLYFTALSVPLTTLALTDRLAVRVFVNNSGRTITLHTQGPHLSQIITDFPSGIVSLNGLTAFTQNFATPGTSGTAPNWSSALDSHTLNIPLASAAGVTAGLISRAEYNTFNGKQDALTTTKSVKILSNNVELDGDNPTPGNDKVYGTNASGTKGWYNAATGGGITELTTDVTTPAASSGVTVATLKANLKTGSFGVTVDGVTAIVQVGQIGYVTIPYGGIITGWSITANVIGSIQFDIWKASGAIPVLANSIVASAFPTLTTNNFITSTSMVGWTLTFNAGDVFGFYVNSVTTIKNATLTIRCTKS